MARRRLHRSLVCAVFTMAFITVAGGQKDYEDLKLEIDKNYPNEPLEYTLNKRFSSENALFRVKQMRDSHGALVERIKSEDSGVLKKDGDMYDFSLDFEWVNWSNAIEGTIRKQEYRIARLEYLLAHENYKDKAIDKNEFDSRKEKYDKAKEQFETFFKSFHIVD